MPATYYRDERGDCGRWAVPLGSGSRGALHDDIAAGTLPAFSFVSPDACDDMHGAAGCPGNLVAAGDRWLQTWLPQIMAGPDYRANRLTVIVTWDEGTSTSIGKGGDPSLRNYSAGLLPWSGSRPAVWHLH